MVKPNTKTEYPTHSTIGGYTIAYVTTDGDCYCGNCIADVVESDIHLLPESRVRDYDYPIPTILYDDVPSRWRGFPPNTKFEQITPPHHLCESCSTDISN